MKFCPKCGCENPDPAKFCIDCGAELPEVPSKTQNTSQKPAEKNKWIAPILDIVGGLISYFLCGIGHIFYLRLYKRGLVFCTVGAFIMAFNLLLQWAAGESLAVTLVSLVLGMGLTIYGAYDAIKCSEAINEGRMVPPLFGIADPEAMSRSQHIILIVLLIVALIAAGAFAVAQVASDDDVDSGLVSNVGNINTVSSDEGLQIRISCPVDWSASVGDGDASTMYEGTGDEVIEIDESQYDVIAAAVQKKTSGSDKLEVQIIKDGNVVDDESTTKDYGVVTVSTTI